MGFLALEATGSLPMTVAVLAACVVSSLTVRRTFGYSFATWRFHLRGEAIRSAVDIGWMRSLTVGRMMRRDMRTVRADTPLPAFKRDFPLGATQRVIALDEDDRYAGIALLPEAHADGDDDHTVRDIVHYADTILLPQMTIKEAVAMFDAERCAGGRRHCHFARARQGSDGSNDGPPSRRFPGPGTAAVSAAVLPPGGAGGHLSVGPACS